MNSSIETRVLTPDDLKDIMKVEVSAWHPEWRAPIEKFEKRMKLFPKGVLGAIYDGRIVGVSTSMPVTFNPRKWNNPHMDWSEITDDGWIDNLDKKGNAIYVVSVAALQRKDYPKGIEKPKGVGMALVDAQIELSRNLNKELVLFGSRLPGFRQWLEEQYTGKEIPTGEELKKIAQQYANLKDTTGKPVDIEQNFYQRHCGLEPIDPPGVKAHFGPDSDSLDFGFLVGKKLS